MKMTCNISTSSWPRVAVARATRQDRTNQGCVFNLGPSIERGEKTAMYLDRTRVSR